MRKSAVTRCGLVIVALMAVGCGGDSISNTRTTTKAQGSAPTVAVGSEAIRMVKRSVSGDGKKIGSLTSSGSAPTRTITEPDNGATLRGDEVPVRWKAIDADGDDLSYVVVFRGADGFGTTVGIGDSPEAILYPEDYSSATSGTLTVTASDGFNSTSAEIDITFG